MLDNMSLKSIRGTTKRLRDEGLRDKILTETSDGITLENAAEYAKTGVDIISMGCLTHSVKTLDLKSIQDIPSGFSFRAIFSGYKS